MVFEETNIKIYWCVKGEIGNGQYHLSHSNKSW